MKRKVVGEVKNLLIGGGGGGKRALLVRRFALSSFW
jgi:hypothetical protein